MKTHKRMLKPGTRFVAMTPFGPEFTYRFVGIDLDSLKTGVGCAYIVRFNETRGEEACVEAKWFCEALTGRMIQILPAEEGGARR